MIPGVSLQAVSPDSRVSNAELFNINMTKYWSKFNCRANIIRIDRRNSLKLINKHMGKHIISIFIHKFISLHYNYLNVKFLYYQKCVKTHLQQFIHLKIIPERTPGPPSLSLKNLKIPGRTPGPPTLR